MVKLEPGCSPACFAGLGTSGAVIYWESVVLGNVNFEWDWVNRCFIDRAPDRKKEDLDEGIRFIKFLLESIIANPKWGKDHQLLTLKPPEWWPGELRELQKYAILTCGAIKHGSEPKGA